MNVRGRTWFFLAGLLLLSCLILGLYFSGDHSPLSVGRPAQEAWVYIHTLPAIQGVETSWRAEAKSIQCEKEYHLLRTRVIITRHITCDFDKKGVISDVRSGWGFKLAPPATPIVFSRVYDAGTNASKFMALLQRSGLNFVPRVTVTAQPSVVIPRRELNSQAGVVVWGTSQEQAKASALLANLNRK